MFSSRSLKRLWGSNKCRGTFSDIEDPLNSAKLRIHQTFILYFVFFVFCFKRRSNLKIIITFICTLFNSLLKMAISRSEFGWARVGVLGHKSPLFDFSPKIQSMCTLKKKYFRSLVFSRCIAQECVQRCSAPGGPACTRNTNAVEQPVHKPTSPLTAAPREDNWRMMSPIVHQIGKRVGENIEAAAWVSAHWSGTVWRQKRRLTPSCRPRGDTRERPVLARWKSIRLYNHQRNSRVSIIMQQMCGIMHL